MSFTSLIRVGAGVVTVAMLVAQTGCSRQQAGTTAAAPAASASLVFANESPAQAEVWAAALGINSRRIGTVMAGETSTMRVPDDFTTQGRVSFYAKLRGSSASPFSDSYDFHPGEELRLRLTRDARTISRVQ
jgi:hypothetical protein